MRFEGPCTKSPTWREGQNSKREIILHRRIRKEYDVSGTNFTDRTEIEFVPDVVCPNCKRLVHLPRETYAWYDDTTSCAWCQADFGVRIGGYQADSLGNPVPRSTPFDKSPGGILLEAPILVQRPNTVPREIVDGMESEKIHETSRLAFRTAIRHFESGRYEDAVVRCRVTIEATLGHHGVEKNTPATMVAEAHRDRLLTEPYEKYAQIVVAAGGRGAHPERRPMSRSNALLILGLTAALLRVLYGVED